MGKRLLLMALLLNIVPVLYRNTFLGVHSVWASDGFLDESGGEDGGGGTDPGGGGGGGTETCDDPPVLTDQTISYSIQGDEIYMIEDDTYSDPCTGTSYTSETMDDIGSLPTISLSVSSSECSPGEQLTLTATPSSTDCFTNATYEFQGSYGNYNVWSDLGSGPQASGSLQYNMRVLGTVHFRVLVTYSCESVNENYTSTDDVSTLSGYCASDLSSDAANDMNSAWSQMMSSSTANPGTKYEYGFVRSFDGQSLTSNDQTFTNSAGCTETINSTTGTLTWPNGADPSSGGTWPTGKFHVHPSLATCTANVCLPPGPSTIDITDGSTSPIPEIVRTYNIQVCGGSPGSAVPTDFPYGPNCTTYQ